MLAENSHDNEVYIGNGLSIQPHIKFSAQGPEFLAMALAIIILIVLLPSPSCESELLITFFWEQCAPFYQIFKVIIYKPMPAQKNTSLSF